MTGVQPQIGRSFREGEDAPGGAKVALLGHAMWRNRFAGDASVLGSSIRVNSEPYEIIGVMPEGFRYPGASDLYLPLQTDPLLGERGEGAFVEVVGQLAPGVDVDQASVEMAAIFGRLAVDHPESNKDFTASAMPFVDAYIGPEPTQLLYTMLGAVFFVLLIACSNVANLLLDRAAHRSKEVGVRAALEPVAGKLSRPDSDDIVSICGPPEMFAALEVESLDPWDDIDAPQPLDWVA